VLFLAFTFHILVEIPYVTDKTRITFVVACATPVLHSKTVTSFFFFLSPIVARIIKISYSFM